MIGISSKIRILYIINGEHYSGGERIQDLLAASLSQFGFEIGFVCVKPDLFPKVYTSGSRIYAVPMRHPFDGRVMYRIGKIVRSEGYQLIHTHIARTALVGGVVSLIAGIPMVHHIHGATLYASRSRLRCLGAALIERLGLLVSARTIACSEGMREYARRMGVREKRISTIPNGIPPYGKLEDRHVPTKNWVFGMTALFRPGKGLKSLLQAIATLRVDRDLEVRFRGIGGFMSEEYRSQIMGLVSDLGIQQSVEWVPFKEDVYGELRKLDCFVLPSEREGLPIAVLEAMAAGLPVVATRVPGNSEVVRDNMDGYLCEPSDVHSLADCLEKMVQSGEHWQTMRRNAHRRQLEVFSDAAMSRSVAEIYCQILRTNCPSRARVRI